MADNIYLNSAEFTDEDLIEFARAWNESNNPRDSYAITQQKYDAIVARYPVIRLALDARMVADVLKAQAMRQLYEPENY